MLEQKRCSYISCQTIFQPRRSTAEYCSTVCRVYASRDRQPTKPKRPDYKILYGDLLGKVNALESEYWDLKGQVDELQASLASANQRKAGYLPEGKPGSQVLSPGVRTQVAMVA